MRNLDTGLYNSRDGVGQVGTGWGKSKPAHGSQNWGRYYKTGRYKPPMGCKKITWGEPSDRVGVNRMGVEQVRTE